MSALNPKQARTMRAVSASQSDPALPLETRWEALHARAAQVAALAGLAQEAGHGEAAELAGLLDTATPWQRDIAARGIEDLDALVDTGLRALSTLTERGQDACAPAITLWREFYRARETVLGVLQPHEQAA